MGLSLSFVSFVARPFWVDFTVTSSFSWRYVNHDVHYGRSLGKLYINIGATTVVISAVYDADYRLIWTLLNWLTLLHGTDQEHWLRHCVRAHSLSTASENLLIRLTIDINALRSTCQMCESAYPTGIVVHPSPRTQRSWMTNWNQNAASPTHILLWQHREGWMCLRETSFWTHHTSNVSFSMNVIKCFNRLASHRKHFDSYASWVSPNALCFIHACGDWFYTWNQFRDVRMFRICEDMNRDIRHNTRQQYRGTTKQIHAHTSWM